MGSTTSVAVEDVPATEVWARLAQDATAVLIDVRTRAEWSFVGVPDLASLGREVVFAEWQTFPDGAVDPAFSDKLSMSLADRKVDKDAPLFFLCRSGARSLRAAQAMKAAGFSTCCNVADGFEGPLNPDRHRGATAGWKSAGLPWLQT